MEKIDLNNWERKELFKRFSSFENPYYNVSFNLDVTRLKEYAYKHQVSFYKTVIYCVSEAVNKTEAFLYIYKDNEVYKIDRREPSYTYLPKDSDNFRYIYGKTDRGLNKFIEEATSYEENVDSFIDLNKESDELIYITCLPWIELTSLTNARQTNDNLISIPKFAWGKYKEENGKYIINMSLEINHAFIDGIHIKKFVDNFNKTIEELEE